MVSSRSGVPRYAVAQRIFRDCACAGLAGTTDQDPLHSIANHLAGYVYSLLALYRVADPL
jgi:hypothetical protein